MSAMDPPPSRRASHHDLEAPQDYGRRIAQIEADMDELRGRLMRLETDIGRPADDVHERPPTGIYALAAAIRSLREAIADLQTDLAADKAARDRERLVMEQAQTAALALAEKRRDPWVRMVFGVLTALAIAGALWLAGWVGGRLATTPASSVRVAQPAP